MGGGVRFLTKIRQFPTGINQVACVVYIVFKSERMAGMLKLYQNTNFTFNFSGSAFQYSSADAYSKTPYEMPSRYLDPWSGQGYPYPGTEQRRKRGPLCLRKCIQKRLISIYQCHYIC